MSLRSPPSERLQRIVKRDLCPCNQHCVNIQVRTRMFARLFISKRGAQRVFSSCSRWELQTWTYWIHNTQHQVIKTLDVFNPMKNPRLNHHKVILLLVTQNPCGHTVFHHCGPHVPAAIERGNMILLSVLAWHRNGPHRIPASMRSWCGRADRWSPPETKDKVMALTSTEAENMVQHEVNEAENRTCFLWFQQSKRKHEQRIYFITQ